jgi:LDH2 family malate/lactate/ureidoglycolate dehydrogenase
MIPGDPERNSIKERQFQGILIDDATWEQILDAGESLGLSREEMLNLEKI